MKAPEQNVRTRVKGLVSINCYGTPYLWFYANDQRKEEKTHLNVRWRWRTVLEPQNTQIRKKWNSKAVLKTCMAAKKFVATGTNTVIST